MTMRKGSDYFPTAFDPRELRKRARKELAGIQFDTVVGTGVSGVLPLQTLAALLKTHTMVVRKPIDLGNSHCDSILEGTLEHRWLFVDDFISSGATFARVWSTIDNAANEMEHPHACVGAFLYESGVAGMFITFSTAKRLYSRVMGAATEMKVGAA